MLRRRCALLGALLGVAPGTAWAEPCTADAETCGRQAFEAGIEAYRQQDFAAAARHFEAAHGFRPHPVVLFNWALAEARLGRFATALVHFDRVLADRETPKELLPEVRKERAVAERNVSSLEVEAPAGAETFVDDAPAPGRPAVVRVDPGEHRVRVTLDGKPIVDKTVRVRSGERLRLDLERPRAPTAPPPPPPPAPPVRADAGPSPVWFYVGAGLTAVIGGLTVWSALDTQRAFEDYERDLPHLNQRQVDARVADGHDRELRTNVLLGATAVAAVGTAALGFFVVDWGTTKERSSAALHLGPAGIAVSGGF